MYVRKGIGGRDTRDMPLAVTEVLATKFSQIRPKQADIYACLWLRNTAITTVVRGNGVLIHLSGLGYSYMVAHARAFGEPAFKMGSGLCIMFLSLQL